MSRPDQVHSTQQWSTSFDQETWRQLEICAIRAGWSRAEVIRQAVAVYLQGEKKNLESWRRHRGAL
jgi:hypothetical protein